jgi:hypothetical protein
MSIVIDPKDDTGFIYYPSSAVCICSSPANEYQNSYYAFDKNRKGTILLGLENAIGFCCSSSRKALDGASKMTLVLTKEGCLISKEEVVTHEWYICTKTCVSLPISMNICLCIFMHYFIL